MNEKLARRRNRGLGAKVLAAVRSFLDPGVLLHPLRLVHYYGYTHVRPLREATLGLKPRIAPNASFANGANITLGDHVQIGARCALWAGDDGGRITVGDRTTFGPDCFVTASDYGLDPDKPILEQAKRDRDVVIGRDAWLGTKVVVVAGVTIGDGAVIGAGSVVTRDVPAGAIAAGVPAKIVRQR